MAAGHFHELEEKSEIPGYFAEVYNPFGYFTFITSEDKDYSAKAEHAAIAYATFAWPLHFGAAISTGGYWANLPPGIMSQHLAVRKLTSDVYFGAAKLAARGGRHAARWLPFAAAAAFAVDMVSNPLDSLFMRGATALFEAVDPFGISSFEMR